MQIEEMSREDLIELVKNLHSLNNTVVDQLYATERDLFLALAKVTDDPFITESMNRLANSKPWINYAK